LNLFTAFQL